MFKYKFIVERMQLMYSCSTLMREKVRQLMCARMSAPARNIIQCDKLEKLVRDARNIKLSFFL